jgi:hypothetical protein
VEFLNAERRRTVALHMLQSFATKPNTIESSPEQPWGFLTKADWDANKPFARKLQRSKVVDSYLPTELKKTLNHPIVLRGDSGEGKTVALAQLVAELLDAHDCPSEKTDFGRWDLVYSQLKGVPLTMPSLESAVCSGVDPELKCNTVEQLVHKLDKMKTDQRFPRLIIIDSLDEQSTLRNEWWHLSKKFEEYEFRVVWSCRKTDFESLQSGVSDEFKAWCSDNTWNWDLELSELQIKALEQHKVEHEGEPLIDEFEEWMTWAMKHTQLLRIFETIFMDEGMDTFIKETQRELLEAHWKQFIQSSKNIQTAFRSSSRFNREYFCHFFDVQPVSILMDVVSGILEHKYPEEGRKAWEGICASTNPDDETVDLGSTSFAVRHELLTLGILVQVGSKIRWRHRDFMVLGFVHGKGDLGKHCLDVFLNEELDKPQSETLLRFQHFAHLAPFIYLEELRNSSGPLSEDQKTRMKTTLLDFFRRTAYANHFTSPYIDADEQIDQFERVEQWFLDVLSRLDPRAKNTGSSGPQKKTLSEQQDQMLHDQRGKTILLRGFPGTGKTFTGVRRLLKQHLSARESKTRTTSLIVALNNHLATNIQVELEEEEYAELAHLQDEEKDAILESIHVRSLQQIFEAWAPDLQISRKDSTTRPSNDGEWLLTSEMVQEWYDAWCAEWEKSGHESEELTYLDALAEVQTDLFDARTGEANTNRPNTAPALQAWGAFVVRRLKERGMWAEAEFAARLKLRLLQYESINAGMGELQLTEGLAFEPLSQNTIIHLKKQFQETQYDTILVDEVQDLNALSVHMLSFLAPGRGKASDQFVLAGDHNQTINGRAFDWEPFLKRLTDLTRQSTDLASKFVYCDKTGRPMNHHLRGLFWDTREEIEASLKSSRLHDNWRNDLRIREFTTNEWLNWPKTETIQDLLHLEYDKDGMPVDLDDPAHMTSPDALKEREKSDTAVLFITTESINDYEAALKALTKVVQGRSGTSLLVTSKPMEAYISEGMEADLDQVEIFNTWTVKGLERDNVLLVGGFMVSQADPETSKIKVDHNKEFPKNLGSQTELRRQVELFRRKHLVAHTRAKQGLIYLFAPESKAPQPFHKGRMTFWQYHPISMPDLGDNGGQRIHVDGNAGELSTLVEGVFSLSHSSKELYSMTTLQEGMVLYRRYGVDHPNILRYRARLKSQLDGDKNDRKGRSVLQSWLEGRVGDFSKYDISSNEMLLHPLIQELLLLPSVISADGSRTSHDNFSKMREHAGRVTDQVWSEESFRHFREFCSLLQKMYEFRRTSTELAKHINDVFQQYRRKDGETHEEFEAKNESIGSAIATQVNKCDLQFRRLLDKYRAMIGFEDGQVGYVEQWSMEHYAAFLLSEKVIGTQIQPASRNGEHFEELISVLIRDEKSTFTSLINAINSILKGATAQFYTDNQALTSTAFHGEETLIDRALVHRYLGTIRDNLVQQTGHAPTVSKKYAEIAMNMFPVFFGKPGEDWCALANSNNPNLDEDMTGIVAAIVQICCEHLDIMKDNLTHVSNFRKSTWHDVHALRVLREFMLSPRAMNAIRKHIKWTDVSGGPPGNDWQAQKISDAWAILIGDDVEEVRSLLNDPRTRNANVAVYDGIWTSAYPNLQQTQAAIDELLEITRASLRLERFSAPFETLRESVDVNIVAESLERSEEALVLESYKKSFNNIVKALSSQHTKYIADVGAAPNDRQRMGITPPKLDMYAHVLLMSENLPEEQRKMTRSALENPWIQEREEVLAKRAGHAWDLFQEHFELEISNQCKRILQGERSNLDALRLVALCKAFTLMPPRPRYHAPDDSKKLTMQDYLDREREGSTLADASTTKHEEAIEALVKEYPVLSVTGLLGDRSNIRFQPGADKDAGLEEWQGGETSVEPDLILAQAVLNDVVQTAFSSYDDGGVLNDANGSLASENYSRFKGIPFGNGYSVLDMHRLLTSTAVQNPLTVVTAPFEPATTRSDVAQFLRHLKAALEGNISANPQIATILHSAIGSWIRHKGIPLIDGVLKVHLTSCERSRPMHVKVENDRFTCDLKNFLTSDAGRFLLEQCEMLRFLKDRRVIQLNDDGTEAIYPFIEDPDGLIQILGSRIDFLK